MISKRIKPGDIVYFHLSGQIHTIVEAMIQWVGHRHCEPDKSTKWYYIFGMSRPFQSEEFFETYEEAQSTLKAYQDLRA